MSDSWCKTCGELKMFSSHRCPPAWMVFDLDNDPDMESAIQVRANRAKEAAEKAHESSNNEGDYTEDFRCAVRDDEGRETRWTVTAQPSVEYHAEEAEEDDAQ